MSNCKEYTGKKQVINLKREYEQGYYGNYKKERNF